MKINALTKQLRLSGALCQTACNCGRGGKTCLLLSTDNRFSVIDHRIGCHQYSMLNIKFSTFDISSGNLDVQKSPSRLNILIRKRFMLKNSSSLASVH